MIFHSYVSLPEGKKRQAQRSLERWKKWAEIGNSEDDPKEEWQVMQRSWTWKFWGMFSNHLTMENPLQVPDA